MDRNRRANELFANLFAFAFFAFWAWGIGWSFYRYGGISGCVAFVVPPYAWYNGLASIWTEPEWREKWDQNTEIVGMLILYSADTSDAKQQVLLVNERDKISKWIKSIPAQERGKLKQACVAFSDSAVLSMKALVNELVLKGSATGSYSADSDKLFAHYSSVEGLVRVRKKFDIEMVQTAKRNFSIGGTSTVEDRVSRKPIIDASLEAMESRMKLEIESLF